MENNNVAPARRRTLFAAVILVVVVVIVVILLIVVKMLVVVDDEAYLSNSWANEMPNRLNCETRRSKKYTKFELLFSTWLKLAKWKGELQEQNLSTFVRCNLKFERIAPCFFWVASTQLDWKYVLFGSTNYLLWAFCFLLVSRNKLFGVCSFILVVEMCERLCYYTLQGHAGAISDLVGGFKKSIFCQHHSNHLVLVLQGFPCALLCELIYAVELM